MILTIIIIIILLVISILLWNRYKFKVKLFIKLHFKKKRSRIAPVKLGDAKYVYEADDDIISGIKQFETQIKLKINDATNTKLHVIISDYPMLVFKARQKHKVFNEESSILLMNFIDTLTPSNYPILQQMPNKLKIYINQSYRSENQTVQNNLFNLAKFGNIINFFPQPFMFTDFINYIYISDSSISSFMKMFASTIKKESELINYCSRTLIFKNMSPTLNNSLTTLCFSLISSTPQQFAGYNEIKAYINTFKLTIEKTKSLIIILDNTDNIIFKSKALINNDECKAIKEINLGSIFQEDETNFVKVIYQAYTKTKNKKMLYILIVLIKLMNQYKSDEFDARLTQAIINLVDNDDVDNYYSTKLENYLYMLFLTAKAKPLKHLIELFKVVIPSFDITARMNGIESLNKYDLREKDVNYVIKVLNLLKYAKEPENKTVILSDYSKTTAYMKVVDHKLIKEDIYYEDFMTLKKLVFTCYSHGINILVVNIVSNQFFKIYYTKNQFFKLHELDHNIFPIDYNHFNIDLEIYKNIEQIVEFVNLKSKYTSGFLSSESYDSLFNNVILKVYTILSETKNYIPEVDNIKYVEFNIRNPLTITPNSIWKYPKLLNDTMLFDLTGKFSVAVKFLYSVFVDSSSLAKEVEKYKELFCEIGIGMDITNFEK